MSDKLKKQLILNLPYILIGLYATKLGEAWRLAEGADASQKFLHLMDGFTAAFQSPLPSFHLSDLLIGLVIGNEGEGVGRLVKDTCDFTARIPMKGDIDSLNASVAAGVLAYEIVRQRMQ